MDVNNYKPSFEAKQFLEEANKLERFYAPSPLPPSRRKSSYKKKPKKKQLKIEKAVKNMTKPPTNFQGVPLDKCTYVSELDKHVFIHKDYEKAWKKVQKEPLFYSLPNDGEFCPDCLLKPCSTRVLGNKLEYDACTVKELAEICHSDDFCSIVVRNTTFVDVKERQSFFIPQLFLLGCRRCFLV